MEIVGVFKQLPDFKIRTKTDAETFLKEVVCAGTCVVVPDLNDKGWHYVIFRTKSDPAAHIAHERNGKSIFEPDFMYSGKQAIDMVFKGRRSINAHLFNRDE